MSATIFDTATELESRITYDPSLASGKQWSFQAPDAAPATRLGKCAIESILMQHGISLRSSRSITAKIMQR